MSGPAQRLVLLALRARADGLGTRCQTTAVITLAMLAGPLGYLLAGPLIDAWGPRSAFVVVAAGQLLATLPFAAVAFRAPRSGPATA